MNLKFYIFSILLVLFCENSSIVSQTPYYEKAYTEISAMLRDSNNTSFKDAVFLVEDAYFDGELSKEQFDINIQGLSSLALKIRDSQELVYKFKDKDIVSKYAALYSLMTDTQSVILSHDTLYHLPFSYDFSDVFGDRNWQKMFVSKLLKTNQGNCHSLPYLYKILAQEIGINAHLALAPNHAYIKHKCEKAGWYNTELTSASFPIDAWLMASGYIHLDAIRNSVYMKALDEQESLSMCLVDLAMGYDKKYPVNNGAFVLQCCEMALEYFPNYINGLLLKAKIKQRKIQLMMTTYKVQYPIDLFPIVTDSKKLWNELEDLYFTIYKLGYRQMPKQMYLNWLLSLKEEKEKYSNRKVTNFNINNN